MQKAAEDLKRKQEAEEEEKRKVIEARVAKLSLDGLDQCNSLLHGICRFIFVVVLLLWIVLLHHFIIPA